MEFEHVREKFDSKDNLSLVKQDLVNLLTNFVKELPTEDIVGFKNKISEICYVELQARIK